MPTIEYEIEYMTVRLTNGLVVLAKEDRGDLRAVTYANRTQAYKKAAALGPEWFVKRAGRPFYVVLDRQAEGL